ncbi:hypothetical protein PG990_014611 [Apiospora arundinis]
MQIRTLDYSMLRSSPDERLLFAKNLWNGFQEEGFVKLIHHGFSAGDMKQLLEWNRKFFALEEDEKKATANVPGPSPQRGWSGLGIEKTGTLNELGKTNVTRVAHGELEDLKEHFDIGMVTDTEFPNMWPSDNSLPGFRLWLEGYFDKSQQIALELMRALETAMGMSSHVLTDRCHGAASELRLNHYPSTSIGKLRGGKANRIWPHTDFGIITLLFQDSRGGLEVEDKARLGAFVPVPREDEAELVINIGDTLERWTNGRLKAGLHRVVLPDGGRECDVEQVLPPRYSVAFFLKASRDASVGPLSHFIAEDQPAQYEDMTALDYQRSRTNVVY